MLVVQGNVLNEVLDTVQVAPMVAATGEIRRFPLNVLVPGAEIAGRPDHVAQIHLTRPVALSRFAPGPVGRVSDVTLAHALEVLRRVFQP